MEEEITKTDPETTEPKARRGRPKKPAVSSATTEQANESLQKLSQPTTIATEEPLSKDALEKEIQKRAEIFAEKMVPAATKHPEIRAGICEFCGESYRTCKHYSGIDIYCTYCGRRDIILSRSLKIFSRNDTPNQLIIVCEDYKCTDAHLNRFLKK